MNTAQDKYDRDPRKSCKYGINCYQKNALHLSTFKHPPKPTDKQTCDDDSTKHLHKKRKLDSEEAETIKLPVSSSKGELATQTAQKNIPEYVDEKDFIKKKFLVEMPPDFYSFWNFCEAINNVDPLLALKDIGLILVGPFEVLGGKYKNVPDKEIEKCVLHWRYFYDPPEFQTVINRDDNSGFHIGYFRDSPDEAPIFLAYNFAKSDGTFNIVGDNLFAAVGSFLTFLKGKASPFMQSKITKYSTLLNKEAEQLKYSMSKTTSKISKRNKQILARTFNKLGFIVPYNKHTQLGYRPLSISNKELQDLLSKIDKASPEEKDALMSKLQVVLTNTNIAIDECDFGTGIELGLDILCSGVESLNNVVARLLGTCYRLLNKETFAVIIESHMKNRRSGGNLSII